MDEMKRMMLTCLVALAGCGACKVNHDIVSNMEEEVMEPCRPIELTKTEAAMTADINALGFKMFQELEKSAREKLQNRFISPLSLSLALSLCTTGAAGRTQAEMLSVLGFEGLGADDLGSYYSRMVQALKAVDPGTRLEIANAIWASNDIKVLDSYIADARKYYGSEVHVDDFSAPSTLRDINSWCSKNTAGKITSILDELPADLKMLLLNALYFNGKWEEAFPTATSGKFTCADGRQVTQKMMGDTREVLYTEDSDVQVAELTYGNGAFAMDIVLPRSGVSIGDVLGSMDSARWEKWMNSLRFAEARFKMPVFKMESTEQMAEALKVLGMPTAFSDNADFSAMSTSPLCISFVKQKTYVDVNEKGTEAAAVTAIGMKLTSAGPSETVTFTADHPFIFAIRERSTGSVLFLGWKTR